MTIHTIIEIMNFFLIYAFLGWIVEVIFHVVAQGVIVNRGFLNGPLCPIYGLGMLLILYILLPISDNLIVLLFGGIILTTSIELFGGWILEKLFHMRWWDYSEEPFNLHGYICVKFSIAWGLGVVSVIRILHPVVEDVNVLVLETPLKWLLIPLGVILIIDIAATVASIMHLQNELQTLDRLAREIRDSSDRLTQVIANKTIETDQKIGEQRVQVALGKAELKDQVKLRKQELDKNLAELQRIGKGLQKNKFFGAGRIIKAYPTAILSNYGEHLKDYVEKYKPDKKLFKEFLGFPEE